jgi:hypothetical protein
MIMPVISDMTEQEFIYAWVLAAKSGSGIAVAWQQGTIEFQVSEAKRVYQALSETQNPKGQ